ncbi:MAG: type II toxin-antitoxin system VapC family toxin [Egibacteraceae bacterium]
MGGRALIDSAVFVYAVGTDHPYREPCRRLVEALGQDALQGEASVEAVQELLHQRVRRTGDRAGATRLARCVAGLCPLHDVTVADLRTALELFARHDRLQARDAIHAATAVNRGIPVIISPDRDFDGLAHLQRVDPVEAAASIPP